MDPRLEANRANWNDRVETHVNSKFYDVEGWLADGPQPPQRETDALGDVSNKTLIHLQCHFGMDTLRWARAGATVTGLDFSDRAITHARRLAEEAGLSERSSFVCANIYDAPAALSNARFDVVYVSLGSLCWLPDIARWSQVVSDLLAPSGTLYLHDVHPFSACIDDEGEKIIYGYFEDPHSPFVDNSATTYTDGAFLSSTRTYEWNHSIGEIVTGLHNHGLTIESLLEHEWTVFQQFPWLVASASGEFVTPNVRPRIPLSFTLVARAPN